MKKLIGAIVLSGILLGSCEKINDACKSEKHAAAIVFDFPDSIQTQHTYELEVHYVLDNSCGEFEGYDVTSNGNSFEVKLKTKYEGCNCSPEFIEGEEDYDIRIDLPGIYEFKFWLADNDFDAYTLKVFE